VFDCPWCGAFHARATLPGADIDYACIKCKRPIELELDPLGRVKRCKRAKLDSFEMQTQADDNEQITARVVSPSINIGTNYGSVAVGSNVTTITNIYNETLQAIDDAKNVDIQQKSKAKTALAYFKDYAPTALPIGAEIIKKTLGL
jgi:hypothetical protein